MNMMGLGLDLSGKPLFPPLGEDAVFDSLVSALERNASVTQSLTLLTSEAVSFRGEAQREALDPGDPAAAGWTFLVNREDPQRNTITEILRPLAVHRKMADPGQPLEFHGEESDQWFDWLHENYYSLALEGKKAPQYILLIGGPDQIPFRFQTVLNAVANVGRADFESLDDLQTYVNKLIRLELAPKPVVERQAIFFAPDAGLPDPTYFSREYMAEPIAEHARDKLGLDTCLIKGPEATKEKLMTTLQAQKPALVYTASHGLGATSETFDVQKQINGAICCQHDGPLTLESLFTAADVPNDDAFLEGSVFFQFACFGYGTPAESDYAHWLEGVPQRYTQADFVAALPKKLLAHPRGPIAYIGHLDTAFLHGFADVESPHILEHWHARISPFVRAIDELLDNLQPSGFAMNDMNARYSVCNAIITNIYDRQRRGKLTWTPKKRIKFLNEWITRGDAQNYMVFGDPAARLRMPE